jgi:hypothetical protein
MMRLDTDEAHRGLACRTRPSFARVMPSEHELPYTRHLAHLSASIYPASQFVRAQLSVFRLAWQWENRKNMCNNNELVAKTEAMMHYAAHDQVGNFRQAGQLRRCG